MTKSVFTERYDKFRRMIVEARKQARVTQVQLAEKLGESQTFVSRYERGERRLDIVEFLDIADVLGIDPHDFISKLRESKEGITTE